MGKSYCLDFYVIGTDVNCMHFLLTSNKILSIKLMQFMNSVKARKTFKISTIILKDSYKVVICRLTDITLEVSMTVQISMQLKTVLKINGTRQKTNSRANENI